MPHGEDLELAVASVATRHDKNDSDVPPDLRPIRLQVQRFGALQLRITLNLILEISTDQFCSLQRSTKSYFKQNRSKLFKPPLDGESNAYVLHISYQRSKPSLAYLRTLSHRYRACLKTKRGVFLTFEPFLAFAATRTK